MIKQRALNFLLREKYLNSLFLFACAFFWSKKYIFLCAFNLCGRVGDKKFFTWLIFGNKATCFGLIRAVSTISLTGYDIIWYACGERKFFFPFRFEGCFGGGCSGQFGTFYFLLIRTVWSWWFCSFHFFSIFQKIRKCLKILFQKIKPVISACFLYIL